MGSSNGVRPYVWMLCGCFWFTLMALLAHEVNEVCDCWQLVAVVRSGLVGVFALVAAFFTRSELVFLRPGVLWVRSLAGSGSVLATFYALTRADFPVSNVLTLTNTFPIWVAVLSWPLLGERPTLLVWGAAACAVVGAALTQQPHFAAADPDKLVLGMHPGGWSALAASWFTAAAMLGLNRLKGVSALGVVVHFSFVAMAFSLVALVVLPRGSGIDQAANRTVIGMLVGVAALAMLGQVFLTKAFRSGQASKVAVVGLSQVVMVLVAEAALGEESLSAAKLLGIALVLGPTAWIMIRERRPQATTVEEPPKEEVAIE